MVLSVPEIFADKICFSVSVYKQNGKKYWKNVPHNYFELTKSNLSSGSGQDTVAVLTGRKNDITVVDIDDMNFWEEHKEILEDITYTDKSFSGKRHLYFKYTPILKNVVTGLFDILGERRTAMLGEALNDMPIMEMPDEIVAFFQDQIKNFENTDNEYFELAELMDERYVKRTRDWLNVGKAFKLMGAPYDCWEIVSMKDRAGFNKNWIKFDEGINRMKTDWEEFLSKKMFDDKLAKDKRKLLKMEKEAATSDSEMLAAEENMYKFAGPLRYKSKTTGKYVYSSIYANTEIVRTFIGSEIVKIAKRLKDQPVLEWLSYHGYCESSANVVKKNHFDYEDKFYWQDFKKLLTVRDKTYYPSEVKSIICKHFSRVLAFHKTFLYIKESDVDINSICNMSCYDFPISVHWTEATTFAKFIDSHMQWFKPEVEFCKSESGFDFEYKNNDVFYASSPFLAVAGETPGAELDLMLDFIKIIICNGDEECFNYMMSWFSFMWKFPNQKSGKALLLFGAEGIGKGTLVEFLCKYVFGKQNCNPNLTYSQLTSHKTSNLISKKLVCVNELACSRNEKVTNIENIKTMITEEDLVVNKMKQDLITVRNCLEFIFMTNNEKSLKIKPGDRRFFMVHCSDAMKENHDFFDNIRKNCFNEKCASQFVTYLEALISRPDDFRKMSTPITEFKKQTMESAEYDKPFYDELLENHENYNYELKTVNDKTYRCFRRDELYLYYKTWMKENEFKPNNSVRFKERLLASKIAEEKRFKDIGRVYAIEHVEEEEEANE